MTDQYATPTWSATLPTFKLRLKVGYSQFVLVEEPY